MPDRIGGTIQAGVLAVPEPHHALVAPAGHEVEQLRAGHRCGRELLVQAGAKHDARGIEDPLRRLQREVQAAEW